MDMISEPPPALAVASHKDDGSTSVLASLHDVATQWKRDRFLTRSFLLPSRDGPEAWAEIIRRSEAEPEWLGEMRARAKILFGDCVRAQCAERCKGDRGIAAPMARAILSDEGFEEIYRAIECTTRLPAEARTTDKQAAFWHVLLILIQQHGELPASVHSMVKSLVDRIYAARDTPVTAVRTLAYAVPRSSALEELPRPAAQSSSSSLLSRMSLLSCLGSPVVPSTTSATKNTRPRKRRWDPSEFAGEDSDNSISSSRRPETHEQGRSSCQPSRKHRRRGRKSSSTIQQYPDLASPEDHATELMDELECEALIVVVDQPVPSTQEVLLDANVQNDVLPEAPTSLPNEQTVLAMEPSTPAAALPGPSPLQADLAKLSPATQGTATMTSTDTSSSEGAPTCARSKESLLPLPHLSWDGAQMSNMDGNDQLTGSGEPSTFALPVDEPEGPSPLRQYLQTLLCNILCEIVAQTGGW